MGGWIGGPLSTSSSPPSSLKKTKTPPIPIEQFEKKLKTREKLFEEYRQKDYGKADAAWDNDHIQIRPDCFAAITVATVIGIP